VAPDVLNELTLNVAPAGRCIVPQGNCKTAILKLRCQRRIRLGRNSTAPSWYRMRNAFRDAFGMFVPLRSIEVRHRRAKRRLPVTKAGSIG
jgi:hypothetical protein